MSPSALTTRGKLIQPWQRSDNPLRLQEAAPIRARVIVHNVLGIPDGLGDGPEGPEARPPWVLKGPVDVVGLAEGDEARGDPGQRPPRAARASRRASARELGAWRSEVHCPELPPCDPFSENGHHLWIHEIEVRAAAQLHRRCAVQPSLQGCAREPGAPAKNFEEDWFAPPPPPPPCGRRALRLLRLPPVGGPPLSSATLRASPLLRAARLSARARLRPWMARRPVSAFWPAPSRHRSESRPRARHTVSTDQLATIGCP